jgi:hypothetical protein
MPTANINTRISDALTFDTYLTYPISSIIVNNGGSGYTTIPDVTAISAFPTDATGITGSLTSLGILGPITINSRGTGYAANDLIVFTGGSGIGAFANVTSVSGNGAILSVSYVKSSNTILANSYPIGGMGYRIDALPTLSVSSANGVGANLSINQILGTGATFSTVTDSIGAVTQITMINYGEDYVGAPNVSLRIQDIAVSNVNTGNLPTPGQIMYQGASYPGSYTYVAYYDSIVQYGQTQANPANTVYSMRVYNYLGPFDTSQYLKSEYTSPTETPNESLDNYYKIETITDSKFTNGTKIYGDGNAKATASFLNGLILGQGRYLDTSGQPSSYSVLQSNTYNNFTYVLSVEKEIAKYRDILLNLIHPSGMKVIGRDLIRNSETINLTKFNDDTNNHTLGYYTGQAGSSATITTDFTKKSNNIITLNYLAGANLYNIFTANSSYIELESPNGPNVYSLVTSVDPSSNTITIKDNVWLTYGNVATATTTAGSNVINIVSLTGTYNIINNGIYTTPNYPLNDIIKSGDIVYVANVTNTVVSVDYLNNKVYVSNNFVASSNSYLSVRRPLTTTSVFVYNPQAIPDFPELLTEAGSIVTTESGFNLLLG